VRTRLLSTASVTSMVARMTTIPMATRGWPRVKNTIITAARALYLLLSPHLHRM